jgi:hypothetical protein
VLRVAAHRIRVNCGQAHEWLLEAFYLQLLLVPTNKQATARACRYQHAHASGTSVAVAVEVHCWQARVVLLYLQHSSLILYRYCVEHSKQLFTAVAISPALPNIRASAGAQRCCAFLWRGFNSSMMSTITSGAQMPPVSNQAHVAASCVGNHDSDVGLDGLV